MHRVCFQESNKIVSVILVTAERLGPLVESDRLFRIHATNYHNSDRSAEKRGPGSVVGLASDVQTAMEEDETKGETATAERCPHVLAYIVGEIIAALNPGEYVDSRKQLVAPRTS
jgi:hypothetical protein